MADPSTLEGRALARKVLETEAAAIRALIDRLDERFDCAVSLLRQCRGRVILTGMGKSGIICRKIAATLTSTGTAAFFMHPAEARHGGLGVVQRHAGTHCPMVRANTRMRDVIYEMSSKGLGMTCVIDGDEETLLGIITDGDLRRRMERGGEILDLHAADVMTTRPVTVARTTLAAEALNMMEQRKITSLIVVDPGEPARVAGVLQIHDLWRMEMF